MFAVSLFITSNLFISDNFTPILQLSRIYTYMECFSNPYVICTNPNNDLDNKSRKRKFNELKEEVIILSDLKNNKNEDLSGSSAFFQEPILYSENSSKNNLVEQASIENNEIRKYIVFLYLKIINNLNDTVILIYDKIKSSCDDMIEYYRFHSNVINKKEFITKIEEILKKLIEKSFTLNRYYKQNYTSLFQEIYKSSLKVLNVEIEGCKIRNLYELLLDINFKDVDSKNKKNMIMKLKEIFLKTEDLKKLEKNIKEILEDNKRYFGKSRFIQFLYNFFNKEEYLILKLIKNSYKKGKNSYTLFLEDDVMKIEDIMEIIKSFEDDKLFFAFRNVSISCLNEIFKRFCCGKKKFEIFLNYMNVDNYKNNLLISSKIDIFFYKSCFEIISAYIYYLKFNINYCPKTSDEKFITKILNLRIKETKFNEKFLEYQKYFDNKEGIIQYLDDNQYLILKEFLNEME